MPVLPRAIPSFDATASSSTDYPGNQTNGPSLSTLCPFTSFGKRHYRVFPAYAPLRVHSPPPVNSKKSRSFIDFERISKNFNTHRYDKLFLIFEAGHLNILEIFYNFPNLNLFTYISFPINCSPNKDYKDYKDSWLFVRSTFEEQSQTVFHCTIFYLLPNILRSKIYLSFVRASIVQTSIIVPRDHDDPIAQRTIYNPASRIAND